VTFSRDMLEMMPQTIVVQAFSALSTDGYGANTHSTTSYSVKCYIEDKVVRTKNPLTGRELVSSRQIYAAPYDTSTGQVEVKVSVYDKITLPSTSFNPQTPPIVNVVHYDDRNGFFGQVVFI
jgi:hypothetical protein